MSEARLPTPQAAGAPAAPDAAAAERTTALELELADMNANCAVCRNRHLHRAHTCEKGAAYWQYYWKRRRELERASDDDAEEIIDEGQRKRGRVAASHGAAAIAASEESAEAAEAARLRRREVLLNLMGERADRLGDPMAAALVETIRSATTPEELFEPERAAGAAIAPDAAESAGTAAAASTAAAAESDATARAYDPTNGFGAFIRMFEQEREVARKERYLYEDMDTFRLALELYNRQRTSPGFRVGTHVANELWECKEVRGRHKKQCSDCDADFNGMSLYVQESSKGPWDAEKLCMGCMGRKLRKAVGTNLAEIERKLGPLRTSQREGIAAGWWANTYMRGRM